MFWPSAAPHFLRFMERAARIFLTRILVLCALTSIAPGQTNEQDVDDEVIRVNTELLLFPIRVRNDKGHAVTGLTEKDLWLKDRDQAISGLYFVEGVDRVALLFALDRSGSVRDVISDQRDAALALFERFSDRSSIGVLQFAETAQLVVPFSKDLSGAQAGFRFQAVANNRTAIFDAALKSIGAFDVLPRVRSERRIVILISDGLDNVSNNKANAVIREALTKRVSFYVIHVPLFEPRDGRLAVRRSSSGFRELAEKTGGKYFLAKSTGEALTTTPVDFTPIFKSIEEDLKSQYLLGFYINEAGKDGRRHVFSLGLVPPGIKYSVWSRDFDREHDFFYQSRSSAQSK